MKTLIFVVALIAICIGVTSAYGQARGPIGRSPNASRDPCPGGGTGTIDTIASPRRLDDLIQLSEVILVGTVVNVLPATRLDTNHLNLIETTSLISVNELLMGTLAPGTKTIAVSQLGGRVEPCELRVPDDPLFTVGEDYVLFLLQDKGMNPPNTTGSPRYRRVGVWSGTAKVVNGNIQFPPTASTGLRNHNNTDSRAFIATLKARINQLYPTRVPKQ